MISRNDSQFFLVIKPRRCTRKPLPTSHRACYFSLSLSLSRPHSDGRIFEEQVANVDIIRFLSNPHARTDDVCRLTLLQSLIIELGLATSSALPSSLSAAKALLKAHAFLNIREYIAVRGQGPEAVQSVMYPSRSALIKSIKKKRNATSIKMVKELGLQVLLVEYMH